LAKEVKVRRSALLAAASLSAVLSACGTEVTPSSSASAPATAAADAPFVVADGEVLVSCGGDGAGWPSSVMAAGVRGVLTDDEARRIFHGILNDPMTGSEAALGLFPDGVDVDWRILREDADLLTIGLGRWTEEGPADQSAQILELEREESAWHAAGWAGCQLAPVLKQGMNWVQVTGYEGEAESARLTAQLSERECTSGRNPERFLHEPLVVETSEKVTIYWTSEPPKGGQDCQGNPSIDKIVELERPLGSRVVLDGFNYPPREVQPR
jgi:hypothetical protein